MIPCVHDEEHSSSRHHGGGPRPPSWLFEPNRRIVLETTEDSSLSATTEIRWQSASGGTEVTMSFEGTPTGALRFLPRHIIGATVDHEVKSALARLKERLEQ